MKRRIKLAQRLVEMLERRGMDQPRPKTKLRLDAYSSGAAAGVDIFLF